MAELAVRIRQASALLMVRCNRRSIWGVAVPARVLALRSHRLEEVVVAPCIFPFPGRWRWMAGFRRTVRLETQIRVGDREEVFSSRRFFFLVGKRLGQREAKKTGPGGVEGGD